MPLTDGVAARDDTKRQRIDRYGLVTNTATTVGVCDGQKISSGRIDSDAVGGRAGTPLISSTGYRCGAELCRLP